MRLLENNCEENFAKFKKTAKLRKSSKDFRGDQKTSESFLTFSVEPFEISKMLENSIFDDNQELRTKNRVLDDSLNSDNLVNYILL